MDEDDVRRALATLSQGGVVAAATETYFGLLADASREDALDRVFALKGRDAHKGVALLLPNRKAWAQLVAGIPTSAARLADRFWPGPLTIALPARADLDPRLTVAGTVGARWPGPSDAAHVTSLFGAPLTATSANRAGEPPAATSAEVEAIFGESIAAGSLVVVRGRAPGGAPSTLVAVDGDEVRTLRAGGIDEAALRTVVRPVGLR